MSFNASSIRCILNTHLKAMKQSRERPSLLYLYNRVGESKKTFVLSHHLSRIMYYPEKQVFTIENQVKFGIIFFIMASGGNHNESTDN